MIYEGMNNKINRYKIGLSISNNNGGLITMLKRIYNKFYKLLENILETIGDYIYNSISIKDRLRKWLKIDLISNKDIYNINKAIGEIRNTDLTFINKALNKIDNGFASDIKAIELTIQSMREEYESLKEFHNNLSIDYINNGVSKVYLKSVIDKKLVKVNAQIKSNEEDILSILKSINKINHTKKDEEIKPNQYNCGLIDGEEDTLKKVIKVLEPYAKMVHNDYFITENEFDIDCIIDDLDKEFIGFKNAFCRKWNNINLSK